MSVATASVATPTPSTAHHSPAVSRAMDNIENRLYRYRAKRIRFLINGDKLFSGINYALNTEKVRSFDFLLNELTQTLSSDHLRLCKGVRYIFTSDGKLVLSLSDFQDGGTYICSSVETFIPTEYSTSNGILNWLVRNSACISSSGSSVRAKCRIGSGNIANNTQISHQMSTPHSTNQSTTATTPTTITTSSHNHGTKIHSATPTNSRTALKPTTPASHHQNNQSNSNGSSSANNKSSKFKASNDSSSDNGASGHRTSAVPNLLTKRTPKNTPDKPPINNISDRKTTPSTRVATPTSARKTAANDAKSNNATGNLKKATGVISSPQNANLTAANKTAFDFVVLEKYDIGRPIGDGHFSVVYCCMNKATQEFCALKLIDKTKCRGRDDMIYNEVKILKQLQHPNIVKLIEEFDFSKKLYLILELVQDGDLFDAISTVTKFNEVQVATMIYNLSSALTYLHKQSIVHRDIKPENLLISVQEDGSQSLKLADFGLAVEVGDSPLHSVCGTAFYVSPEMLNEAGYDFKVDVWSTGVICFILLCGYPPFTSENESNQDELFDAILAGDFQFTPPYWSKISQHAKNLIKCMLTVDPEQRYTAEQVFKHPWTMGTSSNFAGINPMNMSRRIAQQCFQ